MITDHVITSLEKIDHVIIAHGMINHVIIENKGLMRKELMSIKDNDHTKNIIFDRLQVTTIKTVFQVTILRFFKK